MDVTMQPAGGSSAPLFVGPTLDFRTLAGAAENWWLYVFPAIGGRVLASRTLLSTNFKLQPLPGLLKWTVVPFSVSAVKPGVLHFTLDVIAYTGTHYAFKVLPDIYKSADAWLRTLDRQTLLNMLGPARYAELTKDGTVTDLVGIFEMPPAWLTDP
jgi:hypothetical protein